MIKAPRGRVWGCLPIRLGFWVASWASPARSGARPWPKTILIYIMAVSEHMIVAFCTVSGSVVMGFGEPHTGVDQNTSRRGVVWSQGVKTWLTLKTDKLATFELSWQHLRRSICCGEKKHKTSGYATMVHGRGCNMHRSTTTFANPEITSLWHHWWCHNSETIRDREKRRPPRAMKSSELSNGENRIALRQLLQNLGNYVIYDVIIWVQDGNCKKMARENFSIGAFYNITKNQDNAIKTVGRDSFLSPKTP